MRGQISKGGEGGICVEDYKFKLSFGEVSRGTR